MAMKQDKRTAAKRHSNYGKSLGGNLNFAAAEAYRLLRTNLDFSLPDITGCKVIGITSSLRSEGKSTTAVNVAYTMAQTGQRVLLLEADMRLPTAAQRLGLKATPGLSNLLVGQCSGAAVLQRCHLGENLRVITAGEIPPNPAELLNSEQMATAMEALKGCFDVIIVDLPPVSAVSDALIASRFLSGMVVVVREGACSRSELNETMRQLSFTDCKLLGFVMTNAGSRDRKYGYYKKYQKYGYGYGEQPEKKPRK